MEDNKTIVDYAKKTFVALKNPYHSVEKVFPSAIDGFLDGGSNYPVRYVGVKNRFQVPGSLIDLLRKNGNYRLHTLDTASYGGRAVDINLKNPVSGKPMTGSSSGTAINVRIHINDLGVGVDGGGSVLAPAMSVNLYGFISPLIENEYMSRFSANSTDQITFSPSIGFMTREYEEMLRAVNCVLDIQELSHEDMRVVVPKSEKGQEKANKKILERLVPPYSAEEIGYPCLVKDRETIIRFLTEQLGKCDVLLSYEGPVDYEGFGDTIFGHFDELTSLSQQRSGKGLIRAVNMARATALTIPDTDFACGFVLICESKPEKIAKMLHLAHVFATGEDKLLKSYFLRFTCYFPENYGTGK